MEQSLFYLQMGYREEGEIGDKLVKLGKIYQNDRLKKGELFLKGLKGKNQLKKAFLNTIKSFKRNCY